ncbi:hypothetical protein JOB18_026119 [Solea senegalensis]|uniref:Uncharacterized protein n=1 Tax=Solea senegalensis TaxID=28829 RepID=A0AAV6RBT7_SOLSE|nr:hypothetical protein JOB18_026119 [Solea senegalensis]
MPIKQKTNSWLNAMDVNSTEHKICSDMIINNGNTTCQIHTLICGSVCVLVSVCESDRERERHRVCTCVFTKTAAKIRRNTPRLTTEKQGTYRLTCVCVEKRRICKEGVFLRAGQ